VSGECAGERLDAVETSGFSPTEFLSFPGASIQERTSFLNQETVSSNLTLFPHLFTCHVTFYAYVAPYLIEIETIINTHWDCPHGGIAECGTDALRFGLISYSSQVIMTPS
jgi:hypothetical protein